MCREDALLMQDGTQPHTTYEAIYEQFAYAFINLPSNSQKCVVQVE